MTTASSTPEPLGQPVSPAPTKPREKAENLLLNLIFTVAIPTAILSWGSKPNFLGPRLGLLVALAFPVGYGIYDFNKRRKANFIAIVGFASVLISGGFGLAKLDGFWFAVKDAAIPLVLGASVLFSMRTKAPLVKSILFNPQVLDVDKVTAALQAKNNERAFAKLLDKSSYLLAISFLLSAILNYLLARYLLVSPPTTEAFDQELAKMHLWSWPVIVIPSMLMMMYAFWKLLDGLGELTGYTIDDILPQKH